MCDDVLAIAPAAIVDHVAATADTGFITSVLGSEGLHGSKRVNEQEIAGLLQQVYTHIPELVVRPAGSVPNVARTLARMRRGAVTLITACGDDANGSLFLEDMRAGGVDVSHVVRRSGPTGTCLVLSSESTRTMRTFISPNCRLKPEDLHVGLFTGSSPPCQQSASQHEQEHMQAGPRPTSGADEACSQAASVQHKDQQHQHQPHEASQPTLQQGHGTFPCPSQHKRGWVFTSAYTLNTEGLLPAIVDLAHQSGRRVALDLASHELVSSQHSTLQSVLAKGSIDVCICNEDEAFQLGQHIPASASPSDALRQQLGPLHPNMWAALSHLSTYCRTAAIITLGHKGCLVAEPQGEAGQQFNCCFYPAMRVQAVDSTGAGDAFAAGFVTGLCQGKPLSECAHMACGAGAAAVQVVGSDLSPVWDKLMPGCSEVSEHDGGPS